MSPYRSSLAKLGYETIKELETEQGILASGRTEIFGCIFGRDSLITAHKLLRSYERSRDPYLLALVRKILAGLAALQGQAVNIESGEEPGKCIHEFRPTNHEHLTQRGTPPWYVYPDHTMRNYDTVDATPLFLIVLHEYHALSSDAAFLESALPHVHRALQWILAHGDHNRDGFIDYRFHPDRMSGGLHTQNWMDSGESLFHEDGAPVAYPIAPVEVQAYTYAALRRWARFFRAAAVPDERLARRLLGRAARLKKRFNERFVLWSGMENALEFHLAFALDGTGRPLTAARSSMGHVLWAAVPRLHGGGADSILDAALVPRLVERLLAPDLFEPRAGIRTLGTRSIHFDPQSYHNGSIWPHDTAMAIEGLENFGFHDEAARVRKALFRAYRHFKTPVELFAFDHGKFAEYRSPSGQGACLKQAWSAAALLRESLAQNRKK